MLVSGLSLFGFLDRETAFGYLQQQCVLQDASQANLQTIWARAKEKLGPAVPRAGEPNVRDLSLADHPSLQGVTTHPRFADTIRGLAWSFKEVEIAPLLAFQFDVDLDKVHQVAGSVTAHASVDELLPICLPMTIGAIPFTQELIPNPQGGAPVGFRIKSGDLKLRMLGRARVPETVRQLDILGAVVGPSVPYVTAVVCSAPLWSYYPRHLPILK
jgi:hypothetical protein